MAKKRNGKEQAKSHFERGGFVKRIQNRGKVLMRKRGRREGHNWGKNYKSKGVQVCIGKFSPPERKED